MTTAESASSPFNTFSNTTSKFIISTWTISAGLKPPLGLRLFVLIASRERLNSFFRALVGLPLIFYFLAVISWMVWNALAFAASPNMALEWVLDIVIAIPLFAFILRDFLGGHFNFQTFFNPWLNPMHLSQKHHRCLRPLPLALRRGDARAVDRSNCLAKMVTHANGKVTFKSGVKRGKRHFHLG
jgi:hypothetical protein